MSSVFVEYGDDSVAQLGGVHLACEQASNVLSKVLEWGRLMAYLEQSTRYIAYNQRLENGQYRYYRPPELLDSPTARATWARWTASSTRTARSCRRCRPGWRSASPNKRGTATSCTGRRRRRSRSTRCAACLPAASLSNIGIYATGQSYEQLLLRMRAHPLPEARSYAELMLTELRKVIPSFLQRVDVRRTGRGVVVVPGVDPRADRARGRPALAGPGRAGHVRRRRGRVAHRGAAGGLRPRGRREGPGRGLLLPRGLLGARGGPPGRPPGARRARRLAGGLRR